MRRNTHGAASGTLNSTEADEHGCCPRRVGEHRSVGVLGGTVIVDLEVTKCTGTTTKFFKLLHTTNDNQVALTVHARRALEYARGRSGVFSLSQSDLRAAKAQRGCHSSPSTFAAVRKTSGPHNLWKYVPIIGVGDLYAMVGGENILLSLARVDYIPLKVGVLRGIRCAAKGGFDSFSD